MKYTKHNIGNVDLNNLLEYKIRIVGTSSRKPGNKLFNCKHNCSGYNVNKFLEDGMTVGKYQALIRNKFNTNDPQFNLTKHLKFDIEQGFLALEN